MLSPKLRFPEFKDWRGWEEVPLESLARRVTTRNDDGSVTRVLTNSAEHGVLDQKDYFERDIVTTGGIDNYFVIERGDYVYNPRKSTIAPVGPISRNNLDAGVMSPLYTVFRFNADATDFYEHYFKSTAWHGYLRNASSMGARHDRMSIPVSAFMRMPVPQPDPAEQRKIAACLTSLDQLIAAEGRKLKTLAAHKKGLMQQLFPRQGASRPRLRFPEFHDAPAWKTRKLSSILVKENKTAALDDDGTYREIGVRSHGRGLFHKEPTTGKAIGEKRVFHVVPGALVINIVFAWEQALAVTTPDEVGYIASHRFPMFVPRDNQCDVGFMQRLFLTPVGKELLKVASPGGAGRNRTLSQNEFENLDVLVPEVAEQQRIAACLNSVDTFIAFASRRLDALRAHKTGLMQQLFPSPESD
jgi:type I restriction enzyme S subunit